jgi:predicted lipoprotein with Yx(FWY)xxD motif
MRRIARLLAKPGALIALVLVFAIGVGAAYAHRSASAGTIDLKVSPYGKVLVSANGHTLYLFKHDRTAKSTCSGQCAVNWPPLLTKLAKPTAGSGINASLTGTTRRADGKLQVTYHGHPLYWFLLDKKAGQMKGQGVNFFGGRWYVVDARGIAVTSKPATAQTTTGMTTTGMTTTSGGGGGYGGGYGATP